MCWGSSRPAKACWRHDVVKERNLDSCEFKGATFGNTAFPWDYWGTIMGTDPLETGIGRLPENSHDKRKRILHFNLSLEVNHHKKNGGSFWMMITPTKIIVGRKSTYKKWWHRTSRSCIFGRISATPPTWNEHLFAPCQPRIKRSELTSSSKQFFQTAAWNGTLKKKNDVISIGELVFSRKQAKLVLRKYRS